MIEEELENKYQEFQAGMRTHGAGFWSIDSSDATKQFAELWAKEGHKVAEFKMPYQKHHKILMALSFPHGSKKDFLMKSEKIHNRIGKSRGKRLSRLSSRSVNKHLNTMFFLGHFPPKDARISEFAKANPNINCWFFGKRENGTFVIPMAKNIAGNLTLQLQGYNHLGSLCKDKHKPTLWFVDGLGKFHNTGKTQIEIPKYLGQAVNQSLSDGEKTLAACGAAASPEDTAVAAMHRTEDPSEFFDPSMFEKVQWPMADFSSDLRSSTSVPDLLPMPLDFCSSLAVPIPLNGDAKEIDAESKAPRKPSFTSSFGDDEERSDALDWLRGIIDTADAESKEPNTEQESTTLPSPKVQKRRRL